MNHAPSDDDLTPAEAAAFASLPRESSGYDRLAEERTVHALRTAGFFKRAAPVSHSRLPIIGIGIAAAALLFTAGAVFGRGLAAREVTNRSPSLAVQEAGTKYVAALVRLSKTSATQSPGELVAGLEAGTSTLRAAAVSVALIDPEDPVVRRIQASLDAATGSPGARFHNASDNSVIWF